jgi:hypothetical protein
MFILILAKLLRGEPLRSAKLKLVASTRGKNSWSGDSTGRFWPLADMRAHAAYGSEANLGARGAAGANAQALRAACNLG